MSINAPPAETARWKRSVPRRLSIYAHSSRFRDLLTVPASHVACFLLLVAIREYSRSFVARIVSSPEFDGAPD